MKFNLDIPDELHKRLKAEATARGVTMSSLVAEFLKSGLNDDVPLRQLPVLIQAKGQKIPQLTNAELYEILDREDDEYHGRI